MSDSWIRIQVTVLIDNRMHIYLRIVQAYIQEIVTRAVAIVTNESAPEVIHKDVDSISMASSNISGKPKTFK